MAKNNTRLELTWVGKDERVKLEPRVLVEDPEKSYGNPNAENMLIYGDNLLTLKALEQDFAKQIKCIYIDPPFNTGQAFENYEDGLEHSIWLSLIRDRLEILHTLLHIEGTLFVHIDDNELGYLIAVLDEIFGRQNKVAIITFKQGSATGHKAINPGCVNISNFVVIYSKDKNRWKPKRIFTERERNTRYNQFIVNKEEDYKKWRITTLVKAFADASNMSVGESKKKIENYDERLNQFVLQNASSVIQLARPNYKGVSSEARSLIDQSKAKPQEIFYLQRENFSDMYFIRGERILFYSDTLKKIDGELVSGEPLTTIWGDLPSHNLHNEGDVDFPKGKKPEGLIKRVLELSTESGDWVLDSFAGSGTTGAVAHKMGRKWIMCELGEHCHTHCIPRLKSVIDGADQSGISKSVNWQGGGGFKYYRLAESLLVRDKELSTKNHPVYIINPRYDEKLLIRAICKIENFRYRNNGRLHGISSESRFLHITTNLLTQAYLDSLSEDIGKDQSLLIYCTRRKRGLIIPDNIEIKKIPRDLLNKCDFEEDKK